MTKEILLKPKVGLVKRLMEALSDLEECEDIELDDVYKLTNKKIRIPVKEYPLQIFLAPDGKALHLYPEINLAAPKSSTGRFILFDPQRFFSETSGFIRLYEGDEIILGDGSPVQRTLIENQDSRDACRVRIRNKDGGLVFKNLAPVPSACLSPLVNKKEINQILLQRRRKLRRIRKLFGGPPQTLPKADGLKAIEQVNQILADEAYRPRNRQGHPGGVLQLPDDLAPVILGDLHGKVDNLLSALSQSGILDDLEAGKACLLLLGDAVHCEEPGQYAEMDDSLLIMDVIFQLKLAFPEQVFYIRGNHDSFSEEIAKGGVPQGALWEKKLLDSRGKAYRDAMQTFYRRLPYLAYSSRFVACHAAAPTSKPNLQALIDILEHPKLRKELTNNRLYRPHRPGGYTKGDVKRLRQTLGVAPDTPFIVGHTPLTNDETLWENVGQIDNHFVLYSAADNWVGVMALIQGQMHPLLFPSDPIIEVMAGLH